MTSPRTLTAPSWLQPYSDNEMFDIMLHRPHDVRPRLNDTLLHTLASDPDFETRSTIPAPPPSSDSCAPTWPAPPPESAPATPLDEKDAWL
jgi:hypothetical protein